MSGNTLPYYVPYIVSLLTSLVISAYAWRKRDVVGARVFALYILAQSSWTLGYIFELASDSLDAKIFWDNAQFLGFTATPGFFLVFALQYTGDPRSQSRRLWTVLGAISVGITLLAFTDPYHDLIRDPAWLEPGDPFSELLYDFSLTFWLITLYAYGLTFFGFYLMIRRFIRQPVFRAQIGAIIAGVMVPVVGGILTVAGITLSHQRDTIPIAFGIGNLFVAWGLFRFHLFDIAPVVHHTIFETMGDAVIVLDGHNRVIELNSAARSLLNFTYPVIGQSAETVFAPWPELVKRYLHTEQIADEVDTMRHSFDLRILSLNNQRGARTGRLIMLHDITDLKNTERELAQHRDQLEQALRELTAAYRQLEALSEIQDEFVSNVSHELRTPITNLKIHLDLIKRIPEKREHYLETVQHETIRLENLIEGLLTLSRLDQRRVTIQLAPVDLNALCAQYVMDRMPLAEVHQLALRFERRPDLPRVQADGHLIGQVLSILMTNAIQYTPPQGSITISTHTEAHEDIPWAGFSVRDTGPGIPAQDRERLFTRFFRGTIGRESGAAGTGLGLSIAQKIIDEHNGRITIHSTGIPGEGATFTVWLPVA